MAHEVFISYSNRDKPIADGLCANLEAAGVRCWIAPRDIAPGEDWPTAISNALSESRAMVLVFSSNSNNSADVSRELILAANSNLIIIPFRIEDVKPTPGMQYYLARTHWMDAMNPPTQEQINKLIRHVKLFLADTGSTGIAIPASVIQPVAPQPLKPISPIIEINPLGKFKETIQKYISMGFRVTSQTDDSALLEKRSSPDIVPLIASFLLVIPSGIIYLILGSRKIYHAKLQLNVNGNVDETGDSVNKFTDDKKKIRNIGWIVVCVDVIILILLCIFIASYSSVKK